MSVTFQVHVVSARYIMKCDDDNFVRLESVMAEVKKIRNGESLYIGNMNYHHKPLRSGKWAVTYEVSLIFDSMVIPCRSFHLLMLLPHYIAVMNSSLQIVLSIWVLSNISIESCSHH